MASQRHCFNNHRLTYYRRLRLSKPYDDFFPPLFQKHSFTKLWWNVEGLWQNWWLNCGQSLSTSSTEQGSWTFSHNFSVSLWDNHCFVLPPLSEKGDRRKEGMKCLCIVLLHHCVCLHRHNRGATRLLFCSMGWRACLCSFKSIMAAIASFKIHCQKWCWLLMENWHDM